MSHVTKTRRFLGSSSNESRTACTHAKQAGTSSMRKSKKKKNEGSCWSTTTRRHPPRFCWTDGICFSCFFGAMEHKFYRQEDPSKSQQVRKFGEWIKCEIDTIKDSIAIIEIGFIIVQTNTFKLQSFFFRYCRSGRISTFAWANSSTCFMDLMLTQPLFEPQTGSTRTSCCSKK